MNSKIAMSGLSILASFAIMGGATFAFFSSSATSTGNVFAAGNLVLQVDDLDETTPAPTVNASLNFTDLAPGVTSAKQFISLHNGGTLPIAEIELGATKTGDDADAFLLEDVVNLTVTTGSTNACLDNDRTTEIATAAGMGDAILPLTLGELIGADFDALPGLGADYFVCFQGTMDSGAGNDYQGDTVTVTMDFKGNQDASQ